MIALVFLLFSPQVSSGLPLPASDSDAPAAQCSLRTAEAPRGGRLEVVGTGFGSTPVLRIGGRIARQLERSATRIAVQIPRDSNGGPVTVDARGQHLECGVLTIVGKN